MNGCHKAPPSEGFGEVDSSYLNESHAFGFGN